MDILAYEEQKRQSLGGTSPDGKTKQKTAKQKRQKRKKTLQKNEKKRKKTSTEDGKRKTGKLLTKNRNTWHNNDVKFLNYINGSKVRPNKVVE